MISCQSNKFIHNSSIAKYMCRGIYSPTASCSPQSHGLSSERGTRTVCTQSSLYTSNAPFLACPHNHQASLARGITKPPRWQAESARSQRTIHLIQLGHAGCEGRHRQLRVPEVEHHCILCFAKHIQGGRKPSRRPCLCVPKHVRAEHHSDVHASAVVFALVWIIRG